MNTKDPILVAIHCLVYNHAPYLRDCFEGFVKQKTEFRFVAVVHDDCSTDGSADIINEYVEKYPEIFFPIYEEENQYQKCGGYDGLLRVMDDAMAVLNPKYVAICEGDDFWTDPLKLQKQVIFMESHPDFSMCCHGATVLNETDREVDCKCEEMTTREYFYSDAFPQWQIPTASILYRYKPVKDFSIKCETDFVARDVVLILRCMSVGRVWGMEEHMSVYRMTPTGATSHVNTMGDKLRLCKHYEALKKNFPGADKSYCDRYIAMVHYTAFRQSGVFFNRIRSLFVAVKHCPRYVLRKVFRISAKPRTDLFYKTYGC